MPLTLDDFTNAPLSENNLPENKEKSTGLSLTDFESDSPYDFHSRYERGTKQPARATLSGENQFVDADAFPFQLKIGANNEEIRARQQSNWAKFGNATAQTFAAVIGGPMEGFGYLADLFTGLGDRVAGDTVEFNNILTRAGVGLQDFARDKFPVHQTARAQEGGWQALGDFSYWTGNMPTIVSSLSMLVPTYAATRAIGMAGKAIGKTAQGKRIGGKISENISPRFAEIVQSRKAQGIVDHLGNTVLSRHLYNSLESRDLYEQVYEEQRQKGLSEVDAKQLAGEAGAMGWRTGWVNIWKDAFVWKSILGTRYGSEGLRRNYATVSGGTQSERVLQTLNQRFGDKLSQQAIRKIGIAGMKGKQAVKEYSKMGLAEGFEEINIQFQKSLIKDYVDVNNGLITGQPKNGWGETLSELMRGYTQGDFKEFVYDPETIISNEAFDAAFWAFMSGVTTGVATRAGKPAFDNLFSGKNSKATSEFDRQAAMLNYIRNKTAEHAKYTSENNKFEADRSLDDLVTSLAFSGLIDGNINVEGAVKEGRFHDLLDSVEQLVKADQQQLDNSGLPNSDEDRKFYERLYADLTFIEDAYNNRMSTDYGLGMDNPMSRAVGETLAIQDFKQHRLKEELSDYEAQSTKLHSDLNLDSIPSDYHSLLNLEVEKQAYLSAINKQKQKIELIEKVETEKTGEEQSKAKKLEEQKDILAQYEANLSEVKSEIKENTPENTDKSTIKAVKEFSKNSYNLIEVESYIAQIKASQERLKKEQQKWLNPETRQQELDLIKKVQKQRLNIETMQNIDSAKSVAELDKIDTSNASTSVKQEARNKKEILKNRSDVVRRTKTPKNLSDDIASRVETVASEAESQGTVDSFVTELKQEDLSKKELEAAEQYANELFNSIEQSEGLLQADITKQSIEKKHNKLNKNLEKLRDINNALDAKKYINELELSDSAKEDLLTYYEASKQLESTDLNPETIKNLRDKREAKKVENRESDVPPTKVEGNLADFVYDEVPDISDVDFSDTSMDSRPEPPIFEDSEIESQLENKAVALEESKPVVETQREKELKDIGFEIRKPSNSRYYMEHKETGEVVWVDSVSSGFTTGISIAILKESGESSIISSLSDYKKTDKKVLMFNPDNLRPPNAKYKLKFPKYSTDQYLIDGVELPEVVAKINAKYDTKLTQKKELDSTLKPLKEAESQEDLESTEKDKSIQREINKVEKRPNVIAALSEQFEPNAPDLNVVLRKGKLVHINSSYVENNKGIVDFNETNNPNVQQGDPVEFVILDNKWNKKEENRTPDKIAVGIKIENGKIINLLTTNSKYGNNKREISQALLDGKTVKGEIVKKQIYSHSPNNIKINGKPFHTSVNTLAKGHVKNPDGSFELKESTPILVTSKGLLKESKLMLREGSYGLDPDTLKFYNGHLKQVELINKEKGTSSIGHVFVVTINPIGEAKALKLSTRNLSDDAINTVIDNILKTKIENITEIINTNSTIQGQFNPKLFFNANFQDKTNDKNQDYKETFVQFWHPQKENIVEITYSTLDNRWITKNWTGEFILDDKGNPNKLKFEFAKKHMSVAEITSALKEFLPTKKYQINRDRLGKDGEFTSPVYPDNVYSSYDEYLTSDKEKGRFEEGTSNTSAILATDIYNNDGAWFSNVPILVNHDAQPIKDQTISDPINIEEKQTQKFVPSEKSTEVELNNKKYHVLQDGKVMLVFDDKGVNIPPTSSVFKAVMGRYANLMTTENKRVTSDEKVKLKKGVSELFESNPELANIGTAQEYSQYLDTIFPDSKVKDIVYHGTDEVFNEFTLENFGKSSLNINQTDIKGISVSGNKKGAEFYGKNILHVIVSIKNPTSNIISSDAEGNLVQDWKKFDAVIDSSSVLFEGNKPISDTYEIVLKDPKQALILGSKQDIQGFKDYMQQPTTEIKTMQEKRKERPRRKSEKEQKLEKLYAENSDLQEVFVNSEELIKAFADYVKTTNVTPEMFVEKESYKKYC